MARPPIPTVDPASDAAALLRRVGFVTLMLIVPIAAIVARRAVVVLAPIAVSLLVLAAFLDGAHRPIGPTWRRLIHSRAGLAGALVLVWCALSLLWSPFSVPASERLINIVAAIGVAIVGYLVLPDRMRSANLYLVPVGVGAAAGLGIAFAVLGSPVSRGLEEEGGSLERGLIVLALLVWPAVAWMRSRGRDLEALAVAILVAIAVVLGPQPMPVAALSVGALAFAVTAINPSLGMRVTASLMGGLLALAPLLPFVARPFVALLHDSRSPLAASLGVWRTVILSEPVRLVTGHGFETALRGRFVGLLPANAPSTLLFEVWYELGIVGAFAGAFALYAGLRATGRDHPSLVPGVTAAFATAFAFACLGIGTAQMWWFTALAVLILVFVSTERGQFRTKRPKASVLPAANDA